MWYDKELYDLDLHILRNPLVRSYSSDAKIIEFLEAHGQRIVADDIVVVGGHIGNIEHASIEDNVVGLGLSYDYDKCMADPYDWEMYSGYRCSMYGIRLATEEEKRKYKISAGLTCDAAEAADIAYKEKRIWG